MIQPANQTNITNQSQHAEDNGDEDMTGFDPVLFIAQLKNMGIEEASAKRTGANTKDLRRLAVYFKIPKSQKKPDLIKSLFERIERNEKLQDLSVVMGDETYRKDRHTVPRIINLLLAHASELVNIERLATRSQLQQGEIYGSHPLFQTVADQFNDSNYCSGGLAGQHQIFDEDEIDPEKVSKEGKITAKQVYKYYREVVQLYKLTYPKYMSSGFHDNRDFWLFCQGKVDLLYLHVAVTATKNEQVLEFMTEGSIVPSGGVDTVLKTPSSVSDVSSKNPESVSSYEAQRSKKRARETAAIIDLTNAIKASCEDRSVTNSMADRAIMKTNIDSLAKLEELIQKTRISIREEESYGNPDVEEIDRLKKTLSMLRKKAQAIGEDLGNI